MKVVELDVATRAEWDRYVRTADGALPQHLSGWSDVMSRTYGYPSSYIMAVDEGHVVGVLPLLMIRSVWVGSSATTLPGGLCADNAVAAAALVERGLEIARAAHVGQLVLQDTRHAWPKLATTCDHVHCVVQVHGSREEQWNRLQGETRRQVRRAREHGLQVVIDRTGERLGDFHSVLSRFTHQASTPLFGRRFLEHVIQVFPEDYSIAVVYQGAKPIGGYFQMMLGSTVYGIWGATLHEYLASGAAYLAYWQILSDTIASGYRFWDMGRSPVGSTALVFKQKWGGAPHPVYQQSVGTHEGAATLTVTSRVRSSESFRRLRQIWRRLPFPLVQFVGPRLRRHVPFA